MKENGKVAAPGQLKQWGEQGVTARMWEPVQFAPQSGAWWMLN
jgi:hypothetical protein